MAEQLDPAAVFACALSLREACLKRAETHRELNLSDSYNGMDEFMREMMRVGSLFEDWACAHVVFEELGEVWPYLMGDKFGDACLEVWQPSAFAQFDAEDCLQVALQLRLPVRWDEKLRLPVDVRAPNPVSGSPFAEFRVQTVRDDLDTGCAARFTAADEPFDEDYGLLYFALYGVGEDGLLEHIADRKTYAEALRLAQKLAPGLALPVEPIYHAR